MPIDLSRPFIAVNVGVLTVSDTRTEADDGSGALIVRVLEEAGHRIAARAIVKDNRGAIGAQFAAWIADPGIDVVIATGGTGVTPRDVTPEALAPLVTKPIPGFGELFRYLSFAEIGTSTIQSRAEAALCGSTYVFLLPGSTGGVRLGLEQILVPQLDARHRPCNFVTLLPRIRGEREDA
jgi:molybdenum cofactor biosynthesis protein B